MRARRLALALAALALGATAIAWGGARWALNAPGPARDASVFVVEPGLSVARAAARLERHGVVHAAWRARLAARLDGLTLKVGEYRLEAGLSARAVMATLASGVSDVKRRLVAVEGWTTREILAAIADAPGMTGTLPADVAEGELAPDTYFYVYGESRRALVRRMQRAMDARLEAAWRARAEDSPLRTPEALLTLASIVEKETGVAGERAEVAGVFANRLRRGMRLQSDPTVIYGRTRGERDFEGPITRSDLRADNPYNTYVIPALPPGPIANPGEAALLAAARPAATEALYFVADGTGGHAFARTLKEHKANVRRWRALEAARKKQEPAQ